MAQGIPERKDITAWVEAAKNPANVKLVAFLYLLLRDSVPAGEIARLMKEADKGASGAEFTNKHLETYARELAALLSVK